MTIIDERHTRAGVWLSLRGLPDTPPETTPERTALFITDEPVWTAGNQVLNDWLVDDVYAVVPWLDSDPVHDLVGIDVIVAGSINKTALAEKYRDAPIGIVAVDSWPAFGMGIGIGYLSTLSQIDVINASHPLAGGVGEDLVEVYAAPNYVVWATDAQAAAVVATPPGNEDGAAVFMYEAGSTMPGGRFAPARRIGLGLHKDARAAGLLGTAQSIFLAGVRLGRQSSVAVPPAPSAPTLTAEGGDGTVALSVSASGADTYALSRSTIQGGPYTLVDDAIEGATYVDPGLTNGTPYYYVATATNAQGTSPESDEASATPTVTVTSQRLGLHITSDELADQRWKVDNGLFVTTGDFKPNSIGDWARIVANKNAASATAGIWTPSSIPPNAQWPYDSAWEDYCWRARDAAYFHLNRWPYESTTTALSRAKGWLLNQVAAINWTNRSIWPLDHFNDQNPGFQIVEWLVSIAHLYDYLRASEIEGYGTIFTPTERTTVLTWLYHAADFWQNDVTEEWENHAGGNQRELENPVWPNRGPGSAYLAFKFGNGTSHNHHYRKINNRWSALMRAPAVIGALLKAEGFVKPSGANPGKTVDWLYNSGYWWIREALVYAMGPDGHQGDSNRWTSTDPIKGFTYWSATLGSMVYCADIMARMGDFRAYEFTTRDGGGITNNDCETGDPDKSLLWAAEFHAGYVAEIHDHYGTDQTSRAGNYSYKIKSWTDAGGDTRWQIRDVGTMVMNLYFKSELMRRVAERNPGGAWPNIPAGYRSSYENSLWGWMGEGRIFPGVMLMFAHPDKPMSEWPNPYPEVA